MPELDTGQPMRARKLHGTNMALRRDLLLSMGGFDRAFAFYLDDTDLAWRLGMAGHVVRWCPGMVVHHGFAASVRRTAARVPLSLFDIGASSAVYLRKHAPERAEQALAALENTQQHRLVRLGREHGLSDDDAAHLMATLRDGIAQGKSRAFGVGLPEPLDRPFLPLRDAPPDPRRTLAGWSHQARSLRAEAAALIAQGVPVDLFLFEPTPRKHSLRFTSGGWWEQRGGIYGPSDRDGRRVQLWRFASGLTHERRRIMATRSAEPPSHGPGR